MNKKNDGLVNAEILIGKIRVIPKYTTKTDKVNINVVNYFISYYNMIESDEYNEYLLNKKNIWKL